MFRRLIPMAFGVGLTVMSCGGSPCEEAAQICGTGPVAGDCPDDVEPFAECIVDRGSCASADVAACSAR